MNWLIRWLIERAIREDAQLKAKFDGLATEVVETLKPEVDALRRRAEEAEEEVLRLRALLAERDKA